MRAGGRHAFRIEGGDRELSSRLTLFCSPASSSPPHTRPHRSQVINNAHSCTRSLTNLDELAGLVEKAEGSVARRVSCQRNDGLEAIETSSKVGTSAHAKERKLFVTSRIIKPTDSLFV